VLQATDVEGRVTRAWVVRGSWQTLDTMVPMLQTMWPELACVLVTRPPQGGAPDLDAKGLHWAVPDRALALLTELTTELGIHDDPPTERMSLARMSLARMAVGLGVAVAFASALAISMCLAART
jgi:hypothetical protein